VPMRDCGTNGPNGTGRQGRRKGEKKTLSVAVSSALKKKIGNQNSSDLGNDKERNPE
jgi:hypothetical protein